MISGESASDNDSRENLFSQAIVKRPLENTSTNRTASDSAAKELTASIHAERGPDTTAQPVGSIMEDAGSVTSGMCILLLAPLSVRFRLMVRRSTGYSRTDPAGSGEIQACISRRRVS